MLVNDISGTEGAAQGGRRMLATTKGEGVFAYGFRKAGYWLDKTVAQFLIEAIAKTPDKISIVADSADRAPGQNLLQKKPDLQS